MYIIHLILKKKKLLGHYLKLNNPYKHFSFFESINGCNKGLSKVTGFLSKFLLFNYYYYHYYFIKKKFNI
jgi:hypothetical protein